MKSFKTQRLRPVDNYEVFIWVHVKSLRRDDVSQERKLVLLEEKFLDNQRVLSQPQQDRADLLVVGPQILEEDQDIIQLD